MDYINTDECEKIFNTSTRNIKFRLGLDWFTIIGEKVPRIHKVKLLREIDINSNTNGKKLNKIYASIINISIMSSRMLLRIEHLIVIPSNKQ